MWDEKEKEKIRKLEETRTFLDGSLETMTERTKKEEKKDTKKQRS